MFAGFFKLRFLTEKEKKPREQREAGITPVQSDVFNPMLMFSGSYPLGPFVLPFVAKISGFDKLSPRVGPPLKISLPHGALRPTGTLCLQTCSLILVVAWLLWKGEGGRRKGKGVLGGRQMFTWKARSRSMPLPPALSILFSLVGENYFPNPTSRDADLRVTGKTLGQ